MSVPTSDLSINNLSAAIPKTGTIIPNRIFVGGIAPTTVDQELKEFFSEFGAVKDTKIICDRGGASKGYGFVTFETQEDASKIIHKESENLIFKDRKLNIGPAVRKQQAYPRLDGVTPVSGSTTMFLAPNPYGFPATGGLAMLPTDSYQQALQQQVQPQVAAAANYSNMMLPQIPIYMQQPYQYPSNAVQSQVAAAQAIQYANASNQQWVPHPAGCFQQPTVATAVSTPSMYPDMLYAASPSNAGVTQQFLEVPEGTIHENSNDAESRCSSVVTSAAARTIPIHQPQIYQHNASPLPAAPPMKKMTTAASHYATGDGSLRCYGAPLMGGNIKPAAIMPGAGCAAPRGLYLAHDMRVKFEHDGRMAANIAPPTPPATPASGSNSN